MVSFVGKYGITGAVVAAAARYAVGVTNPVALVALAALPVLPWASRRLSQCCFRQREPERIAAPVIPAAPAAVQGHQGLGFDAGLAAAIRRSRDEAVQVHLCPYVAAPFALRGLDTTPAVIPESLLYEKADGTKCNLAHYLATLLFQNNAPGPDSQDFSRQICRYK